MEEFSSKQCQQRVAVSRTFCTGRTPAEVIFFDYPKRSIYNHWKKFTKAADPFDVSEDRKEHSRRSDSNRDQQFLQSVSRIIAEDPGRSMAAIEERMEISKSTIYQIVHEELDLKSYKLKSTSCSLKTARLTASWRPHCSSMTSSKRAVECSGFSAMKKLFCRTTSKQAKRLLVVTRSRGFTCHHEDNVFLLCDGP